VFTKTETPVSGQAIVTGLVPGGLEDTRSFYEDSLEDAGYREGRGESEPGEAEATFTGPDSRGSWRANEIPDCDAVLLTLVVVKG
jgi:hypothetical protein